MEKTMPAKLAYLPSHPNRSRSNIRPGANPSPAQVRRAREDAGARIGLERQLTQEEAGGLVFSNGRSWQNWEADADSAEHRRMHPATFENFNVKVAALELIRKRELSPSALRALGLYIPEDLVAIAMGKTTQQ
jgi:hypothetical protein